MSVSGPRRTRATPRNAGAVALAFAAIAALLPLRAAMAEPIAVVNALRLDGDCTAAAGTVVGRDASLDLVAEALSRGVRLEDALERAGYPAASSTALHVGGASDDAAIRQVLAKRFCKAINDPRYQAAGAYRTGSDTWIVLAARAAALPTLASAEVAARVLELVNAARGEPRRCGRKRYEAAQPLRLSVSLNDAALGHAHDMAARGALGHDGSDGSTAAERIARAGYRWRTAGENVAAGQRDAEAVVAAWLASPGHCANLMGSQYAEMGVAFALAPAKDPAIYWTQVFAAP